MQTPICEVCLNSDMLCAACQNKLESGQISQIEINVSRFLFDLKEKIRSLEDVKIVRVLDVGSLLIIARIGDGARLVGKGGAVVKTLAKKFGKSIRIIEEAKDFKKFAESLISPISSCGINTLYTLEGEVYRVRIRFSQKNSLSIQPESFSEIINNLYHCKAELVFES